MNLKFKVIKAGEKCIIIVIHLILNSLNFNLVYNVFYFYSV